MPSIPTLTSVSGNNANTNWAPTAIRVSTLDQTNPSYARVWRLDSAYLTLSHAGYVAGVELSAILPALLALVPQLTWPPLITVQPTNELNLAPGASASFSVTATSEISITYQWQVSTNGGTSFSNVSNGGVYSNVTTATMNISSVTGLINNLYQCVCTNASGSTTSDSAVLTTDPGVTVQPSNSSVVHPAATNFAITAVGQSNLSYVWAVNNGSGYANIAAAGTPNYSGYTTNVLAIGTTNVSMNTYLYHCIVTDTNGTLNSNAATLTVT
jgi:hypothetical protein